MHSSGDQPRSHIHGNCEDSSVLSFGLRCSPRITIDGSVGLQICGPSPHLRMRPKRSSSGNDRGWIVHFESASHFLYCLYEQHPHYVFDNSSENAVCADLQSVKKLALQCASVVITPSPTCTDKPFIAGLIF